MNNSTILFETLVGLVRKLRDPDGGCPWDLEQTHTSLRRFLIEEAYEVIAAIEDEDSSLPEELGDVLLQVVLHSQLGRDGGTFSLEEVLRQVITKLVIRHPHVFGEVTVDDTAQVLKNWEEIKKANKSESAKTGALAGVPRQMPALLRAQRVGEKAARLGFDWQSVEGVKEKVIEEVREFIESSHSKQREDVEEELGDLFFALVQLTRHLKMEAEDVLTKAIDKFTSRFHHLETLATGSLNNLSHDELEALWQKAKLFESNFKKSTGGTSTKSIND